MTHIEVIEVDINGNEVSRTRIPDPLEGPPLVPVEIQMWQARTMIERMGLTQAVNEAVAFADNEEIRIAWEYAPNVVRKSGFVSAMAAAIGLTDGQLDTLFIEAAKVK